MNTAKPLITSLLLSVFCISAFGQITIKESDMAEKWQKYTFFSGKNDKNFFNPTKFDKRASWDIVGTAHSQDKSEAYVHEYDEIRFGDTIEGVNMVVVRDTMYHLYNISEKGIRVFGAVELHTDTSGKDSVLRLHRNLKTHSIVQINMQFEDVYTVRDTVHVEYKDNDDEYRREQIIHQAVSVNGWGQAKMPDGKHYSVLRLERQVSDTFKYYKKISGKYELENTTSDKYYVNEFWGKKYGLAMAVFVSKDSAHKEPIWHEILDINNTFLSTPEVGTDLRSVKVFPNPVTDILHFSIGQNAEVSQIEIHNLTGQKVMSATPSLYANYSMNLSHLNPGVYLLSYVSDSQKKTVRIIKK